ncbi:hypothetical protein Tco_0150487 [Tanacetum coccineum]
MSEFPNNIFMNLLIGLMTPEQFQQYQQEQQQAFFRWQQSQILNRDLDNLQQNPPSFHSESSQTLTQPQQVDSPKKDGRKKTKARKKKNVEDESQEPVAASRWLPFNAAYKRAKRLGKSGENDVDYLKRAQSIYRDEHRGVAFSQEDAWAVLRFHPKWDAPEQVDLTGDVPGASQEDLFGHDARPRPPGKQRPAKKSKSDATASTGGSSASAQFGELMEQELRLKREAVERAFEAQAEKDRTLIRLKELRFLATSTKDLDEDDAYWIKKQKKLIKNKMIWGPQVYEKTCVLMIHSNPLSLVNFVVNKGHGAKGLSELEQWALIGSVIGLFDLIQLKFSFR